MTSSVRIDDLQRKYEQNSRRYFAPLASELRRAGDARRAVALCEAGVAADPEHLSGHVVLAQALADLGDRAGAERSFARAVELDPENIIALRSLGDLARDRGDREGARGWYQHALEADPRDPELATRLSTLDSATADSSPSLPPSADSPTAFTADEPTDARAVHAASSFDAAGAAEADSRTDEAAADDSADERTASAAEEDTGDLPSKHADAAQSLPLASLPDDELDRELQRQRNAEEFTAGFFAAVLEADRAADGSLPGLSESASVDSLPEAEPATSGVDEEGMEAAESIAVDERSGERADDSDFLDDLLEFPVGSEGEDGPSVAAAGQTEAEIGAEPMLLSEPMAEPEAFGNLAGDHTETAHPRGGAEVEDLPSNLLGVDDDLSLDASRVESLGESTSETPTESMPAPTGEFDAEPDSHLTTEPVSEWATESSSEVPADETHEVASELALEPPANETHEVASELASDHEVASELASEPPADETHEVISEPDPELTAEATTHLASEPVSELTSEATPDVVSEPDPELTAQATSDAASEPVSESTSETTPELSSGSAPESTEEATSESIGETIHEAFPVSPPDSSDDMSPEPAAAVESDSPSGSAQLESPESAVTLPDSEMSRDQAGDDSAVAQWREEITSARSRVEISTDTSDWPQPSVADWSDARPADTPGTQETATEPEVDQPMSDEAAAIATPIDEHPIEEESSRLPFVTVTMGKLLLQQGFRSDALKLFRQLAAQHPDDSAIRQQVAELEEELHPAGGAGSGVTVGTWLRDLARIRPASRGEEESSGSAASASSEHVEPVEVDASLRTDESTGGQAAAESMHPREGLDVAASGSDLLSSAAAAAAAAVSWEATDSDPSIDDFLFSDDPMEWGEVMPAPTVATERVSDLTLDELLGRPVSVEDELAAGALASATMAMQHDQETDAQLAEASAEDPRSLEHLLAQSSAPDVATTRETGGFSFEQFFQTEPTAGGPAETGAAGASSPPPAKSPPALPTTGATGNDEEAAAREADLADFHAWLAGLSKS